MNKVHPYRELEREYITPVISQHKGLTGSTELSPDALREFIEATRGRGEPTRVSSRAYSVTATASGVMT